MAFLTTLFLWAAAFVAADFYRKPQFDAKPSGKGDFQAPTSTMGRPLPFGFGTFQNDAPNVLWYGKWNAEPITVKTGVVFRRREPAGYRYRISMALGFGFGEMAGIRGIVLGDNRIWSADEDNAGVPGRDRIDVDLPELYGGELSGGGFRGSFEVFTGSDDQAAASYLTNEITDHQSGWPGLHYVIVRELEAIGGDGAVIGERNGLRDVKIEWQSHTAAVPPAGFPASLGDYMGTGGDTHFIGLEANPMQVAYRLITDPIDGMGLSNVNLSSFRAAAQTCFDEGIGFSYLQDRSIQVPELLILLQEHVDGYIGEDPESGLFTVTLARQDYDPATILQATPANIREVRDAARPEWNQLNTEVTLRFSDRARDYDDNHALYQDAAARIIAARANGITIAFPGCKTATIGNLLVNRSARAYTWPLSKAKLIMNREAWAVRPGTPILVAHPDFLDGAPTAVRATQVRIGDQVNQEIEIDVVQDVFRVEPGIFAVPPDPDFVPPAGLPVPVTRSNATLAPRFLLDRAGEDRLPRVLYLAARDVPNTGAIVRWRRRNVFGAGSYFSEIDEPLPQFQPFGTLTNDLPQLTSDDNNGSGTEIQGAAFRISTTDMQPLIGSYQPTDLVDGLFVINPGNFNEEIVAVTTVTQDVTGILCSNVIRGIGDTAIAKHAASERVYFLDQAYVSENQGIVSDGGLQYKFGGEAFGDAEDLSAITFSAELLTRDRALRPLPPGPVINPAISTSTFFPAGPWDGAGVLGNINSPTGQGLQLNVYNRRFEQLNPVYGANGRDDSGTNYPDDTFDDVVAQVRYRLYDLDLFALPLPGDEFAGGIVATDGDRVDVFSIPVSDFRDYNGGAINCRIELRWENAAALLDVPADVESRPLYIDRQMQFTPDSLDIVTVDSTVFLLRGDEVDGVTTQFIDHGPNNFAVTPTAPVEVDTNVSPDTGLPNGHILFAGGWLELPDSPAWNFASADGVMFQLRVYFPTNAPSNGGPSRPLIHKWDEAGNARSFFLNIDGSAIVYGRSDNGTTIEVETTGALGNWAANTWYQITVTIFGGSVMFFRNGVFLSRAVHAGGANFDSSTPVRIGADNAGNGQPSAMHIDEARLVKLDIRKAGFTVPQAEYPGRGWLKPLHCQFDRGADGDTAYDSEDLNRWQFQRGGTTRLITAQSKFGGLSLQCDGVNSSLTNPNANDGGYFAETLNAPGLPQFDFQNRDFTKEGFARFVALPSSTTEGMVLVSKYAENLGPGSGQDGDWLFYVDGADVLRWQRLSTGFESDGFDTIESAALTLLVNTWYHWAVVRQGDALGLLWEGNRVAYVSDFFVTNPEPVGNLTNAPVRLGSLHNAGTAARLRALNGQLDEVRIRNGTAEYDITQATYTVPSAAFPVDPAPAVGPPPAVGGPSNWQPPNLVNV